MAVFPIQKTPLVISGLKLWLDANDPEGTGIQLNNGDPVAVFYDKSGSKTSATQLTSGAQPIFTTNLQAGKPGIVFNGSSSFMRIPAGFLNKFTTDIDVFVVAKQNSLNASGDAWMYNSPNISGNRFNISGFFGSTTNAFFDFGDTAGAGSSNGSISTTQSKFGTLGKTGIWEFSNLADTTQLISSNAGIIAQAAQGGTKSSANQICELGRYNGTYYTSMTIFEIVVYNRILTTSERETLNRYLSNKWAIALESAPAQISGGIVWYDAANPNNDPNDIPADNTKISAWLNCFSNTHNLSQPSGSIQPTFKTNILNGKPAVRFDGTNSMTASLIDTSEYTAFCVFKGDAYPDYQYLFYNGANTSNGFGQVITIDRRNSILFGGSALKIDSSTPYDPIILNDRWDNVESTLYMNGVAQSLNTSFDPFFTPTGDFVVGSNASGAETFFGDIHEIIIYNRALSDAERLTITNYLSQKWGISLT